MYRIVLFQDSPDEPGKPIWKAPGIGRKFIAAIIHQNNHYDAIKKIHSFFGIGRKYCVDCEKFYSCDQTHTVHCARRCYYCGRCGPDFPCAAEEGVNIHCSACNRTFFSHRCYELHKAQTCSIWKKCSKSCGKVYRHDAKRTHICYNFFCRRCGVHHDKNKECFIKKISVPKEKQRYRIVVWDSESSQNVLRREGERQHIVNFISARITCTDCADSGEKEDCEICMNTEGIVERSKYWLEKYFII